MKLNKRTVGCRIRSRGLFGTLMMLLLGTSGVWTCSAAFKFVQPVKVGYGTNFLRDAYTPVNWTQLTPPPAFLDTWTGGADLVVKNVDLSPAPPFLFGIESRSVVEFNTVEVCNAAKDTSLAWDSSQNDHTAKLRVWFDVLGGNSDPWDAAAFARFKIYPYWQAGLPDAVSTDYHEGFLPLSVSVAAPGVYYADYDIKSLFLIVKAGCGSETDVTKGDSLGFNFRFERLGPLDALAENLYLGNYADYQPQILFERP